MTVRLLVGDCRGRLGELPDGSAHCCVTSPPYFGLRDYDHDLQLGQEPTPDQYVAALVEAFRQVRRVLRDDGTLWLNIGDSYARDSKWGGATGGKHNGALHGPDGPGRRRVRTGLKDKDLIGIPWLLAFALRADGWFLRQDIIWAKPSPMPEPVQDRCTKAHEYLFLLAKRARYYFNHEAIAERATVRVPGNKQATKSGRAYGDGKESFRLSANLHKVRARHFRNKRDVWEVATQPYPEAHFATYPPALIEPCILAGSPPGGTVLDPFAGAGTTGLVADRLGRHAILVELNPAYADMARRRLECDAPMLAKVSVDPQLQQGGLAL